MTQSSKQALDFIKRLFYKFFINEKEHKLLILFYLNNVVH